MSQTNVQSSPENGAPRAIAGRCCLFISSSDRARDVFEIVFQNSDNIWSNCDWPRYVGFTSKHPDMYGFKAIPAKAPSGWREEFGDQLDCLPDEIEYVLRLDEDALFMSPVDGARLNEIAELMVRENLSYVSLIPVRRNLPGLAIEFVRRMLSKQPLRRLSLSEPYYNSVAVVLWKRSYLRSLLRQPGSIWEFEHVVSNEPHYAVWKPVLDQYQIVSKGKWDHRAPRLLARQGLSLAGSKRGFETLASRLRGMRERVVFQAVGFLSFRVRRRLNKIPMPKLEANTGKSVTKGRM
jgi:hypothetical protein